MSIEALRWILWILFGGWGLYLSGERSRIVEDIKEIKKIAATAHEKAETLQQLVQTHYLTKGEHKDFDSRISASIDRLSDRIDKAIDHMREK